MMDEGVNLGSGDIGVLNYAYAPEQLEAAFYTQVLLTPFDAKSMGMFYLKQIRDHEIAHREFFKSALGSNAIPALEVNFSSINFKSRESVLNTAKAFEDLGVPAYNGAGPLLVNADYLTLALLHRQKALPRCSEALSRCSEAMSRCKRALFRCSEALFVCRETLPLFGSHKKEANKLKGIIGLFANNRKTCSYIANINVVRCFAY